MKKQNSPAERHIAKIVMFFVGLTGFITYLSLSLTPTRYAPYVTIVTIVFGMLGTWFGRELVFQKILMLVPSVNPRHKLPRGTWNIYIKFDDSDGQGTKERSGCVTMYPSLLGIRIKGGMLLNEKNKRITMNGWYADAAEVVTYDDHDILYYLYKIPIVDENGVREDENKFEKIGFVCAIRVKGEKIFEGYFRDIDVKTGASRYREGTVSLFFSEP
jgi:hypothetical protein